MNQKKNKRTWWCDTCHVPLLKDHCLSCGSVGRDICSATLVPVFRPEIQYLKKQIDPEIYPLLKEGEIWISPGSCTYYCQGIPIAKLTAANGKAKKLEKSKSLKPLSRTLKKCLNALNIPSSKNSFAAALLPARFESATNSFSFGLRIVRKISG